MLYLQYSIIRTCTAFSQTEAEGVKNKATKVHSIFVMPTCCFRHPACFPPRSHTKCAAGGGQEPEYLTLWY